MTISRFFRTALAFVALGAALIQPARADIVELSGDTTGSPTYNRALSDFSKLSNNGKSVPYDVFAFTVTQTGEYSFVGGSDVFDTFLFLYKDAFDPSNALLNGVAGSDDLISTHTSGIAAQLYAGTQYFLVVTGFYDDSFGNYEYLAIGPGAVALVPEPSTWLMLGGGLAFVGWARRRAARL